MKKAVTILCFLVSAPQFAYSQDALETHGFYSEKERKDHRRLEGSSLDKSIEDYSKVIKGKTKKQTKISDPATALKAVEASKKLNTSSIKTSSAVERARLARQFEKSIEKKEKQKRLATNTLSKTPDNAKPVSKTKAKTTSKLKKSKRSQVRIRRSPN